MKPDFRGRARPRVFGFPASLKPPVLAMIVGAILASPTAWGFAPNPEIQSPGNVPFPTLTDRLIDPRLPQAPQENWSFAWHWRSAWSLNRPLRAQGTSDTAEVYGSNWHARKSQAENTLQWLQQVPFLATTFAARHKSGLSLLTELPLRRDLRAWQDSRIPLNGTWNPEELDLNAPYEGWIDYRQAGILVRMGRQRLDADGASARSPTWSLQAPMDAFHTQLQGSDLKFSYSLVSLNPWLLGDPQTNTGEWPLQRRAAADNQHGRIYAEPERNLLRHRLLWKPEFLNHSLQLGMQELALVGGRGLQLRDAMPLHFWHNNFQDGQVNSLFAFDLAWLPQEGFQAWGELAIDEIQAGADEAGGNPGAFGTLVGLAWLQKLPKSQWKIQIEGIQTDDTWGAHRLPLLRLSHRLVLKSNALDRQKAAFADTYVADLPLGYFRGPGARDLWWDLMWWSTQSHLAVQAGLLSRSGAQLTEDPELAKTVRPGPTRRAVWCEIRGGHRLQNWELWSALRYAQGDDYQSGFEIGVQRSLRFDYGQEIKP
jgi:hypothetical protein